METTGQNAKHGAVGNEPLEIKIEKQFSNFCDIKNPFEALIRRTKPESVPWDPGIRKLLVEELGV